MDIEELSKTQIILLVLLVTFVTSIATGIVTVSLLAQAPPAVTQTVNHIIQRTVEAVTPAVAGVSSPTTVKETTVVVKEDDLITSSIGSSFAKVGMVHEGTATSSPVVALGVLVSGGVVLTDSGLVSDADHVITFEATSTIFSVKKRFSDVGVAVMSPKQGTVTGGFLIASTETTKLGQTVIAIPSGSATRVGIGAVAARYTLARLDDDGVEVPVRAVETNIGGKITGGAPLITVFGDIVGIATGVSQGEAGSPSTFVAVSDLAPLFLGVRGTSTPPIATPVQ